MKKAILFGVFLFLGSLAAYAQAYNFTIVNQTGLDIYDVYVSPSEDDDWYDSWFSDDYILFDGDEAIMEFDEDYELELFIYEITLFDIRIVDENGDEYVFTELALEDISKIILTMDSPGNMRASWR